MAERLDEFDFRLAGRERKYPWSSWSDGSIWRASRGVDFTCNPKSFYTVVKLAAKSRGQAARVRIEGDSVVFQFGPKP